MDSLIISDNGTGISYDDLPLAFARHTTSKIYRFEDLFSLNSYGFRGEALASVSSIARIQCTSIPKEKGVGGKIVLEGGVQQSLLPLDNSEGHLPHGTTMVIKDLFYNTPARLKFIKSKHSEKSAIKKILWAFLLTWPKVRFILQWDQGAKEIFEPDPHLDGPYDRIRHFFSLKKEEKFMTVKGERKGINVQLYINTTATGRQQQIFVNDRMVQDKNLHQRLIYTLEGFFKGTPLNYLLFLHVPPDSIDVNVHPHKTFIKFEDPALIYELVIHLCQEQLIPYLSAIPSQDKESHLNSSSPLSLEEATILQTPTEQRMSGGRAINLRGLLISYLHCYQEETPLLTEENILPLLISETYSLPASTLDALRAAFIHMGLEWDRLNEKTVIMRTTPFHWFDWPYQTFLQSWLTYCYEKREILAEENLNEHFSTFLHSTLWNLPTLSSSTAQKMVAYLEERNKLDPKLILSPKEWIFLD